MSVKLRVSAQTHPGVETGRVLVVDDHRQARESMTDILRAYGHQVSSVSSAVEALQVLAEKPIDVIVSDLQMPGMTGLDLIRELSRRKHGAQVVMVTAHATVTAAVEAMRHGAFDFIEKPFGVDQLEQLVARALRHGRLLDSQPAMVADAAADDPPRMIGASPAMQRLRQAIARAAPTNETILICGASGTGKELVARAVHAASNRAAAPLVSLNCPVLSAHLLESELFGHEKGAFTGADAPRIGRFELADGGTILLDEISEIDPSLQAKLLRVLQERTFERVGSSHTRQVDVRVIATTNRDLQAEVRAGRFRQDLFYRLAVIPLEVPALSQRRGDVPELIDYFLARAAQRLNQPPATLDASAVELLVEHPWPGNVRELENIVTRASVLSYGEPITADQVRPWLMASSDRGAAGEEMPVGLSLHELERKLIEATLDRFGGHRAKTAQALGIGLRTLTGKLKEYGYAPRTKVFAQAG